MPENHTFFPRRSPFPLTSSVLLLIGFVLMGLFVGQLLGLAVALGLTGVPVAKLTTLVNDPAGVPRGWAALMCLQAGASLGGFVVGPLLHWRFIERQRGFDRLTSDRVSVVRVDMLLLAGLAVLVSFPLNTWFYELNRQLDLPASLQGLEDWIRSQETNTEKLTKFLTNIDDPLRLLVGMLVIAVIPAVGEEITFRGVGQNVLHWAFGNIHVAIWVTAALFSAIHLQFYGFLPRLLLGALFGYLYAWSGSLWVPIFAHFVNNGFQLLALYLFRTKLIETDLEKVDSVPLSAALISLALTGLLLLAIRRRSDLSFPPTA